jgi:uncharacterized membrane protein YhaH (DUF805 family)
MNNHLFRLLFDYRGTVIRHEYLAALVAMFICHFITFYNILYNQYVT